MYIILIVIIILLVFILCYYKKNIKYLYQYKKNILHNYFDDIYIITLPQRKEYIKTIMDDLKINPIYFEAIDKNRIDYNKLLNNNFILKDYYKPTNHGRIACHYSHMKILETFLKTDKKSCFIFEDDISPINIEYKDYNNIIKNSLDNLPSDWDIIKLGRCWDNCTKMDKINEHLYRVYSPKCRHAYGVSRKGAKKILDNTIPMYNNGDVMISNLIKEKNIICYAIVPSIFNQNRYKLGSTLNNSLNIPLECSLI